MEKRLFTLTYFSRSALTGDLASIKHQVNELLSVSQRNNNSKEITGALLYSGGYFIQVLEGAQLNVEEVFESIMCDVRHTDVTVLSSEYVSSRSFANWSMALVGVMEDMPDGLNKVVCSTDELGENESGTMVIDAMVELLNKYQALEQ